MASQRTHRPAWWLLYALVPFMGMLVLDADWLPVPPAVHTMLDVLAVLAGLGLMALWLRANRIAMVQEEYGHSREGPREDPLQPEPLPEGSEEIHEA